MRIALAASLPSRRVDPAAGLLQDARESVEVAGVGVRDQIYVLRAANITPCIHREPTNDHEAHVRGDQPVEQLA